MAATYEAPTLEHDAMALAERIASGELGAAEALEAAIERCEAVNPQINAVCNPAFGTAREQARAIDIELVAARRYAGAVLALRRQRPFLGVPSLLKDLSTAATGLPSTMGSRLFGRIDWPVDSALVARYRRAGLVFFGRTTSPEMGISPSTEAVAYGGPTRNPWSLGHSPGGSSGGAGAAVAADIVTIAHATDGAGSIRIPATNCGLFGIKPSRGLMPAGPLAGEGWGGLATEHLLTRSVRDSALALDVSAGADIGAPYAAPPRPPSYLELLDGALRQDEAPLARRIRLRIACSWRTLDGDEVHPEVAAAVREAAQLLESLGHIVEETAPRMSTLDALGPMLEIIASGTAQSIGQFEHKRGHAAGADELEATTHSAVAFGRSLSAPRYLQAIGALHRVAREMGRFMHGDGAEGQGFDLFLTPVLATPPIELGRIAMSHPDFIDYRTGPKGIIRYSPFTPLANATGQPSASVPFALGEGNLPIGIQLTGRFGEDWRVLQVAAQIERARPWPAFAPFGR
jgi:amidase